jgi:hypothetical protein
MRHTIGCLAGAGLAFATAAFADPPPPAAPDKSGYTLFDPTPDAALRSLCTDRPTKSASPCTVDAGHWQVESDIYNLTVQRGGGVTVTTELFTNPTLKLGLTNRLDLEVSLAPYERVTVKVGGVSTHSSGVGDLFLRAKANLLGDDGGNVGLAISPFIKVPTASRGLGNGAVEAGVAALLQVSLPDNWSLNFDPELDALENAAGDGRHLNSIAVVSLNRPVSKTVTLSGEVWSDMDFDPAGRQTQVSADVGAAWVPAKVPTLQLDGGVNFGLNRATPGVQVYVGISKRF